MTQQPIRYRTCIATRERYPDTQLLRIVIDPADDQRRRVLADPRRRLPGRGAWITPDLDALERAQRRRAIGRALRASKDVDTGHVREYLELQVQKAEDSARPRDCKEDRTLMSAQR